MLRVRNKGELKCTSNKPFNGTIKRSNEFAHLVIICKVKDSNVVLPYVKQIKCAVTILFIIIVLLFGGIRNTKFIGYKCKLMSRFVF